MARRLRQAVTAVVVLASSMVAIAAGCTPKPATQPHSSTQPHSAGEPVTAPTHAESTPATTLSAAPPSAPRAKPPPAVNFSWRADDGTEVKVVDGLIDAEFFTDGDFGIGSAEFRFAAATPNIAKELLASEKVRPIAAFLEANPGVEGVRIEAFAGQRCHAWGAFDLSRRRAHRIARALVDQGIACERLEAVGCAVDDSAMTMRFKLMVTRFEGAVRLPPVVDEQPSRLTDPCASSPSPTPR